MTNRAKIYFDYAFSRAEHLLKLYQLVNDTGRRKGREPFMQKVQEALGNKWKTKKCFRVWGEEQKSFLIIQASSGVTEQQFRNEYTSELLRSSLVSASSALDRYLHEIVIDNILTILKQKEDLIPRSLKNLPLDLIIVKKAIDKERYKKKKSLSRSSRTFAMIKKAVQEVLHEKTFQSKTGIEEAFGLLGIRKIWKPLSERLDKNITGVDLVNKINELFRRRNQIVHEADLQLRLRAGSKKIPLNPISEISTIEDLQFIKRLICAMDIFISEFLYGPRPCRAPTKAEFEEKILEEM